MSRRPTFWVIAGVSVLIPLTVAGAILYSLFNEEVVSGDGWLAYLSIFALVFSDAIIPIFPGETTLSTASVSAAQGTLELGLVIVAGALGAVLGDSALYWIVRMGPRGLKDRLERASQRDERVAKGLALLGRSGPLLIACGRFIPGVRFAVNVSMGLIEYPYRRFLLFSVIGGVSWAIYTCLLAYWIGDALADFPIGSIVVSSIVTSVLIGAVYVIDRRRRRATETEPPQVPGGADRAQDGSAVG